MMTIIISVIEQGMLFIIENRGVGRGRGGLRGLQPPPLTKKKEKRKRGEEERERKKKEKRGIKRERKLNQSFQEHVVTGL